MRIGLAQLRALPAATQLQLAVGQLPPDVPTDPILHELVHHMCANSAVNIALQYRWLELMRASLSSPIFFSRNVNEERTMTMAAGLAALEDVLQPIAEGLAHFAEFDCAMPDVEQYQRAGYALPDAASVCLLRLRFESLSHVDDFAQASRREKLSESALERRGDVLCHPLFPTVANDTYLLGYMLIKAIVDRLPSDVTSLRSADAFGFLYYYVYEDWVLAGHVATPGSVPIDVIVQRLESRLDDLLQSDIGSRIHQFKEDIAQRLQRGMLTRGPEERKHGPFAGLGLTKREIMTGMTLVSQFYDAAIGPRAPLTGGMPFLDSLNEDPRYLRMVAPLPQDSVVDLYYQRHPDDAGIDVRELDFILEIPMLKRALGTAIDMLVEFRADSAGELNLRSGPEAQWDVSVPSPAGRKLAGTQGVGRLVGIFMSTNFPWRFYCYLFVGVEIGALWGLSDDRDEQREVYEILGSELQFELASELTLRQLAEYLSDSLRLWRTDSATTTIADAIRRLLRTAGWAGAFSQPAADSAFGLRSLLGSGSAVRALSTLGLCNAFTVRRSEIESLLTARGHDLHALVAACERCESATGFRPLECDEHVIRARV